ncbi:hypothetical protein [Hymenobacter sp.]|jgi:hypothetical protein|uniref:hypothetical protein n=1 Tax=Hymenobacter sp. TaxID=1898978 RepID=UPI002ED87365
MPRILLSACLALLAFLTFSQSIAQQITPPATRPLVVNAAVGGVIDAQEKATYGLFPYYSADNFVEARFEQLLAPDSTIRLRTQLRDGRTILRPFSAAEFAAMRTSIETRLQEISRLSPTQAGTTALTDSIGRRFRVLLRTGTAFDGELTARRPTQLEFMTSDLGVVQVERTNIARLEELTSNVARRPANWYDIGNGNRLFFQPTARNLRRGEGALQTLNLYVLGINYGITNHVSMGLLASVVPGIPLEYQVLAFTPKVSGRLSEKWYAGAGALYLRAFETSAGILYVNTTYGSADNNLTLGLGYGFFDDEIGTTPVVQIGGQTRVSRRVSLISENYIIADSEAGLGGLYGVKINWRRTSLGLGAVYVAVYRDSQNSYDSSPRVFSSYVIPLYYDFTFRFGKGSR